MNFISTRDFVDDLDSELDNALNNESKIHISVKQRTTRKKNTVIENLDTDATIIKSKKTLLELMAIMKKKFNCGGHLENGNNERLAIVLTGDVKIQVKDFLKKEFMFEDSKFVTHG